MAVTKRIFQLSKEFERDEKEIIAYLAEQGIKVSNRLSAVSEETYNMLKAKFMAPPPPPPEPPKPEPAPEPEPAVKESAPAESAEA
ncbi:MAG: translation initiation factor IF-2 N-terminal domain-containing protein, partial [Selenomonadaceae bacterium]|nr:translation initiation factor IF-2 N-terminal domain-containing protein [Selenomonadaceae bacterium]